MLLAVSVLLALQEGVTQIAVLTRVEVGIRYIPTCTRSNKIAMLQQCVFGQTGVHITRARFGHRRININSTTGR